ncbi:hypothetical protein BGX27_002330 [Mortierella sp. AM989]|nr:hypothetical protein BGX27_002330 [Mortierella sp. AM989]
MSQAPNSTNSICTRPVCPTESIICAPSCKQGYTCTLSVIDERCQCPKATCANIGFDTGADNGGSGSDDSSSQSVVGPVVGAIAGLGVVALIAFLVIRRQRKYIRHTLMAWLEQDHFESVSQNNKLSISSSSDSLGNKDVIRIAYIPSIIGESPIENPAPSVQSGGVLKPNFTSYRDEERNKHDSVSSLDEAVVMAVTKNATPQVMKLNAIKANQSDLIHRSNSLHSSNSAERSKSQRRIADTKNNLRGKNPSPLGNEQHYSGSDLDSDGDETYTGTGRNVFKRSSSAPSAMSDYDGSNPFMTETEKAALTHSSTFTDHTRRSSTARATSRSSNPFLSIAESTIITTPTSSSFSTTSSQPGSPMSDTTAVFASIPITLGGDHFDNDDPLSGLPTPNLRPWAPSSASTAMRDSTFSTLSDSRSSTRGDGEEIMIFWDGHRDSKANM